MEADLSLNIAGSKVLVFVEGITDLLVFNEFKNKIQSQAKIHFMELEGFSNFGYYAESKVVRELKIPVYLIFDGDTREEKKQKMISSMQKQILIISKRVYTLQKSSIESYLLNPKAIVEAYPAKKLNIKDIQEFLNELQSKKNKKTVMELLFTKFKIGSYSKESAKRIASKFGDNEIDVELRFLLTKIAQLKNV
jgi:predicted ATP-dependent endonuclease of OLD family